MIPCELSMDTVCVKLKFADYNMIDNETARTVVRAVKIFELIVSFS